MSNEVFMNYWIGQEPTGPGKSPQLNQIPSYVDIVPLAFVTIDDQYQLSFDFLTQQNSADTIKGWIKEVKANGTKVLLSINSDKFVSLPDVDTFATQVAQAVTDWGVDGIDIDFEPPSANNQLVTVTRAIRQKLVANAIMSSPIYFPWEYYPQSFIRDFAASLDYISTMDYTPYPGYDNTIQLVEAYAKQLGSYEKLLIGMSCMQPSNNNATPLDDVKKLSAWEPTSGQKAGAMLYTFSYDIEARPKGGTGYPDGTYTKTIHDNLP
ncbi:glycosyl hydrolase family 18 protein [Roseivirga sp. BDSF3-8]|uniref:glycosyl hydrolase family 18 protein n=1 Tax=Roseivirga sp. BDSF3-8 TaxID=3241598 RepID=UPI003532337A